MVTVYYTGSLINGTVFDGTEPGLPAQFKASQLIPGWTEALELMREGDHWQICHSRKSRLMARAAPAAARSRRTRRWCSTCSSSRSRRRRNSRRRTTRVRRATGRSKGSSAVMADLREEDTPHASPSAAERCALRSRSASSSALRRCSGPAATTRVMAPDWDGQVRGIAYNPSHLFTAAKTASTSRPSRSTATWRSSSQHHRPYPHLYGRMAAWTRCRRSRAATA